MERLQKVIAASGIASRRQAEVLIQEGRVRVNKKVVREMGVTVDPAVDSIEVNNRPLPKPEQVVYALHKPKGHVTSRLQQGSHKIITELVPPWPPVYPVGRLDKESEGLILLTNKGDLAHQLTHPSFEHAKEYRVRCGFKKSDIDLANAVEKLRKGVKLSDGRAVADQVRVVRQDEEGCELVIVVHEGRHHLVRRMCASVGLSVRRLFRTKIATISVDKLRPGQYRLLTAAEVSKLI